MGKIAVLAYANDNARSLIWLEDESKTISEYFRRNNKEEVEVVLLPEAELKDIRSVLTDRLDDIILFHFSGHADPASLYFSKQAAGGAEGIAGMMGVAPNLQFVFLNGCATKEQVAAFHAGNVKAVIATSRKINDELAAKFSKTFYACFCRHMTLGKSYELAKGYTSAESKVVSFLPDTVRHLGALDHDDRKEFPWGIYYNALANDKDVKKTEDWTLPERGIREDDPLPDYKPCYSFAVEIAKKAREYFSRISATANTDLDESVRTEIKELSDYYQHRYLNDEKTFKELAKKVKDIMPYPLACWYEKILRERKRIFDENINGPSYYKNYENFLYLQISFYQSLIKICTIIMLSDLYNFLLRWPDKSNIKITKGQHECIERFFEITEENKNDFDYTSLVKSIREVLEINDTIPFINEYEVFKDDFRHNEDLFEAHMEINSLKYRLQAHKINDSELKSYCKKSEELLWKVFEKVYFILRYKMVIIRKIEIIKYRRDKPKFIHSRIILHNLDDGSLPEDDITLPIEGVEIDPAYTDSYSVMLFRGLSDFSSYLNLSPLAIDLNALKGEKNSLLYLYSHLRQNGEIVYEQVEDPKNSLPLFIDNDGTIDYVKKIKLEPPAIAKVLTGKLTVLHQQFKALRDTVSNLKPYTEKEEPEAALIDQD